MSTRPPIPDGRPPPYAFVGRMYRRNLRPVVIGCGCLAGLWTLIWGVSQFQAINIDRNSSIAHLVTFDIVLGSLYLATFAIEAFGVFAAVTQRIALARLYAIFSLVAAALVFSAEVLTIVLDFLFKGQLIQECTDSHTGAIAITRGWWGTTVTTINADDARRICTNIMNREIFADFAWLFVSTILSLMFSAVAFAFYRQLLDPASTRAASTAIRMNAFPQQYSAYPAPAGPPPGSVPDYVPPYDPHKVPDYDFADRELGPEKAPAPAAASSTTNLASNPFEPPAGNPFQPPPGNPFEPPAANPFARRAENQ